MTQGWIACSDALLVGASDVKCKVGKELGRNNLVFPILYIPVPALTDDRWHQDPIIGSRQYEQWQNLRHLDPSSTEVALRVEKLCENISKALQQPWLSAQERREAEARQQAEEERRRREKLQEEARHRTAAASQRAGMATSAARAIGDTGQRTAGRTASVSRNWLYWLIPLLAIVALLIYFFANRMEQVAQQGLTAVQSLTVGGVDLAKQVTDNQPADHARWHHRCHLRGQRCLNCERSQHRSTGSTVCSDNCRRNSGRCSPEWSSR